MDAGVTIFTIAYVVILIVPGIIFKRCYFVGAFAKQFNQGPFADRIITSLFCGILVQLVSLSSFSIIINAEYATLKPKLINSYKAIQENKVPDFTSTELIHSLYYAIYSVCIAAIFGYLLYRFVRFTKLDLNFPPLRFANHWHYYFKGEILKTTDFQLPRNVKVISTEVDVRLKDNDGNSNLFSGLLTQYTLGANNQLETIYLTGTSRYAKNSNSFKPIPGDIFIIPYETIKNINIRYNFQQQVSRGIFRKIIVGILALVLICFLYYPWSRDSSIWLKIAGTFVMLLAWFGLTSFIMSFFNPANGAVPITKRAKFYNFLFMLSMLLLASWIFNWWAGLI